MKARASLGAKDSHPDWIGARLRRRRHPLATTFAPAWRQVGMERRAGSALPISALELDLSDTLAHVLELVRWITIVALFLLSLTHPLVGRLGQPTWMLVVSFAAYSAGASLLSRHMLGRVTHTRMALLDLLVVSLLYTVAASPSGPLFALFVLVTVSASCTLTLRRSLLCTGVALLVLTVVSPTLPMWNATSIGIRDLLARLIVLALASVGAALLMRQLKQERYAAHEATEVAKRHAEYNAQRDAFVALTSHELRTPLTALRAGMGLLELSLSNRMRDDETHLLGTARRNSERLGMLVDDLLTYNQLEADALWLERDALDLGDVVCQAVNAITPLLREKEQTVRVDVEDRLGVFGDARRLEQTVLNLIANAHEHTPAGTHIVVAGQVTADEIILTISDNGPGIAAGDCAHIFDRFYRANPAGSKGSGLGLLVAKRIVELHGGRLWVGSSPGVEVKDSAIVAQGSDRTGATGATFCLALPRQIAENP